MKQFKPTLRARSLQWLAVIAVMAASAAAAQHKTGHGPGPGPGQGHAHGYQQGNGTQNSAQPGKGQKACRQGARTGSLRLIMCDLGKAMNKIQMGIWNGKAALVAEQAGFIADHPHVDQKEKGRIQKALGSQFKSFVQFDQAVHRQAVQLRKTAQSGTVRQAWLKDLQQLQNGCVACHTAFQSQLSTTD